MLAAIILAAATAVINPKSSPHGGVIIECGDGGGMRWKPHDGQCRSQDAPGGFISLVPRVTSTIGAKAQPAQVFALTYKMCATDKYTDGKERTACAWDNSSLGWVYVSQSLCDSEGKRELSVNYGDWRTLDHERLQAVEYRCAPLMILTPKDIPHR